MAVVLVENRPYAFILASHGIASATKSMQRLDELINKSIPWVKFKETMRELNDSKEHFSYQAAHVVGQVAQLLLSCGDRYMSSVNAVDRWCKIAVPLLEGFMRMFEKVKEPATAEAQRKILHAVLTKGSLAINDAMTELKASQEDFNRMTSKLYELEVIFNNDLKQKNNNFFASKFEIRAQAGISSALAGGALFGPIGLALATAAAAGIVEGNMIPELQKAFDEVSGKFSALKDTLVTAGESIVKAKSDIDSEITKLDDISGKISVTENFAEVWATCPDEMFEELKNSTKGLIQLCKDYSTSAEMKRKTQWQ